MQSVENKGVTIWKMEKNTYIIVYVSELFS